ncbi:FAD-binding oxidoreductase [Pseudomaricurvus alkylphenolicus]|jgi:gamma-glutamylputrescine oxidase|uniref:NAD(P)/FAD-dependent oxidoreductase n=1 Tax=Pseudomaricurvus alkylphenolicus TaxID=1306991 RepID=UPI00141E11D0|nr:FAD-binding oxidoreductase [Pseudomaricurvus alkylphenolicus]NIB41565.1 FAD-binding oxidoreductase [Pseudomaricurvus alkylphenolicus]
MNAQVSPARRAHTNSYYAASRNDDSERAGLQGTVKADVCIVGGGFTGLSAGIHLARAGYKVVLLEANRIGWGASGRNGGQAIIGYNSGIGALESRFGLDAAKNYLSMALEGCDIIRQHIEEFQISCDFKPGHVGLATDQKQLHAMEKERQVWARCGRDDLELIPDRPGVQDLVASSNYVGGFFDPNSAHLHPLNLALGEARALESLGGVIHEHSPVTKVDVHQKPVVHTEEGRVNADYVLLAGNAYLGNLIPSIEAKLIPVSSFVIATEPLGEERAAALLKKDYGYTDWRYVLDYYRLSADKRLLFGGKSYYGGAQPANFAEAMRQDMLKVFPQLSDVKIDYAWGGNFAITYSRMPDVGRLRDSNVFYAHGYSGHGVTTTHIVGRLLSEMLAGNAERFDYFSRIRQVPFPGGKYLKVPAVVMGSWYYRLRDMLGASRK